MKAIFTFPFTYPSMNRITRMHWAERERTKKQYWQAFRIFLRQAGPLPIFKTPVRERVLLFFKKGTRRDVGNYDPKWLNDCLVKEKIIVDDSSKWIPDGPRVHIERDAEKDWMILEIESLKEEKDEQKDF